MRRLSPIGFEWAMLALAILMPVLLFLTGCAPSRMERSQVVKICPSGATVAYDPKTKAYWFKLDDWEEHEGWLPDGAKPEDFC